MILDFFQFSTWLTAAILFFEKNLHGENWRQFEFRLKTYADTFLKFSAFYIFFFHFHITENLMLLSMPIAADLRTDGHTFYPSPDKRYSRIISTICGPKR